MGCVCQSWIKKLFTYLLTYNLKYYCGVFTHGASLNVLVSHLPQNQMLLLASEPMCLTLTDSVSKLRATQLQGVCHTGYQNLAFAASDGCFVSWHCCRVSRLYALVPVLLQLAFDLSLDHVTAMVAESTTTQTMAGRLQFMCHPSKWKLKKGRISDMQPVLQAFTALNKSNSWFEFNRSRHNNQMRERSDFEDLHYKVFSCSMTAQCYLTSGLSRAENVSLFKVSQY